jgi:protein-tyrosine phosphatase
VAVKDVRGGAPRGAVRLQTVCWGNICRSPMAEVILQWRLDQAGVAAEVTSTGVSDEEHGHPIDRRARACLERHGYEVPGHRARRIEPADMTGNDLLLVMEVSHRHIVERLARDWGVAVKVRLLAEFDPSLPEERRRRAGSDLDIPDPWYGGPDDFEDTLVAIEAAAPGVVAWARGLGR